jgi:signal transduction histidine kinase/ligand-binding sensor domain-containing protein
MDCIKLAYLFLTCIIGGCFWNTAFAQLRADQYSITFLTTQDGLSQATNFSMLQDSKGYMWIGSQDGINRYDGKRFSHFSDSFYYKDCKPPKQIFGVVEDAIGNIWMGSREALYQYQQYQNSFQRIDFPQNKASGNSRVFPFATVGNEVWFLKDDLLFMAIDCRTKKIRQLYHLNEKPEIIDPYISTPQTDENGTIWITNGNRLYEINTLENRLNKYIMSLTINSTEQLLTLKGLSLHKQSGMLVMASDMGVVLFDTKKKEQKPLIDKNNYITGVDTWLVKASSDCFWVSNENYHLIKLSLDGRHAEPVFEKSELDNDIHRGSPTSCIYIDKWSRLWLNANGEYIAVIDFSKKFMRKIGTGRQGGLLSGTVTGITASDSILWLSDNYLTKINKTSGRIEKIFSAESNLKVPGVFRQVYFDSLQQRLWFNTNYDLWYYSIKEDKFRKTSFWKKGSPTVDYIRNFISLPNQKLLLARIDGVFNINRQDGTATILPAFRNNNINHLCKLSNSRFALSVDGQPLQIFDYTADMRIALKKNVPLGNSLLMTAEDSLRNVLWAASEKGVYKLDNKTFAVLYHYTIADGMANDFVYAVIPDRYGWAWCSTNKGIVAINGITNQVRNFDSDPNLQALEYNNRAFASDSEGYIYFGGVKGINYFKPPFIDSDTILPKLVVEDIFLNNSAYRTDINPDDIETVAYDYSPVPLLLKVQALHLVKTSLLKIIYRIKGQAAWAEINNGEYISMYNLSPGTYILEINYKDGNTYSAAMPKQIYIIIKPPFYRTWWFLLSIATSIFLLAIYFINRRQKIKLEGLQMENEIITLKAAQQLAVTKERERIMADLHDDIGASLSSMSIYSDLAGTVIENKPEESKELVNKVSVTSKELMERMGDIIWSMKPADEDKYTLEARLKNYCKELLSPKNIICEFDIDAALAASITNPEIRKNILLIAKEAINNAAKYSSAKKVFVVLTMQEENIILKIQDNGIGIEKQREGGNGLKNMRQRCEQSTGIFNVSTEKDNGTTITCKFPIAIISHKN